MADGRDMCVDPDAPLSEVLPRLAGGDLGRLLVCRDGHLEGLLSLTDVTRVMQTRTGAAWPVMAVPDLASPGARRRRPPRSSRGAPVTQRFPGAGSSLRLSCDHAL